MMLTEEIKALEFRSLEEIYAMIGDQLLSKSLAADDFLEEEKREQAIIWEKQQEPNLRKLVCQSYFYRAYIENSKGWDWVVIVAAISDLIAPAVIGVSPVTLATLILKKGLDSFCTENER